MGDCDGNGLPRADHLDTAERIATPVDAQRQLAPIQHPIAPQRADPDADALSHSGAIGADRAVDGFAARARAGNEPARVGIQIRGGKSGAVLRGSLRGEDGGNESREHHV